MLYNENYSFDWDEVKATTNFIKHGVRFSEAVTIWYDDQALEVADLNHSHNEERWLRIGHSNEAKILVVVYCENIDEKRIRIISARKANEQEQRKYLKR